jgi:hypothetical protein
VEEAVPEEEAAPPQQAPLECPEDMVPYEGRCITLEEARELGIITE